MRGTGDVLDKQFMYAITPCGKCKMEFLNPTAQTRPFRSFSEKRGVRMNDMSKLEVTIDSAFAILPEVK